MGLDDVRRNWEAFGEQDPMWAILTGADTSNGRWDEDGFFATGALQAGEFIARLDELGLCHDGRMLDFGCGMGRMTQAFAASFRECVGVDIARSMITRAEAANRHGDRVRYVVNDADNLTRFDDQSFDFVFSYLVLQHMAPDIAVGYVREFFRLARVGATLVLQLPTHIDPVPLPDSGFRAELSIRAPKVMEAGATAPVEVLVRNASPVTWAAGVDPGIGIGNHWRKRFRRTMVAFDGARAPLDSDVGPGDTHAQTLMVRAPDQPGTYLLEVDMVQELVAWFAMRGSGTASASVKVTAPRGGGSSTPVSTAATAPVAEPVMEVHGIEKDDVLALVAECGGTVVAADRNPDARPWESFTYFITKARHVVPCEPGCV